MTAFVAGQLTMEKTPAYFVEDDVASRVHQMNSSIRLLVTFRDPVDRAISDYLQVAFSCAMLKYFVDTFAKVRM